MILYLFLQTLHGKNYIKIIEIFSTYMKDYLFQCHVNVIVMMYNRSCSLKYIVTDRCCV